MKGLVALLSAGLVAAVAGFGASTAQACDTPSYSSSYTPAYVPPAPPVVYQQPAPTCSMPPVVVQQPPVYVPPPVVVHERPWHHRHHPAVSFQFGFGR